MLEVVNLDGVQKPEESVDGCERELQLGVQRNGGQDTALCARGSKLFVNTPDA
jgi:hypothetical protein